MIGNESYSIDLCNQPDSLAAQIFYHNLQEERKQNDISFTLGQAENSTWSNWNEWSTCREKDGKCQKTRQRFCTVQDISQCKNKFNISSEFDEDAIDCGGLLECKSEKVNCYIMTLL